MKCVLKMVLTSALLTVGCGLSGGDDPAQPGDVERESWAVTAWGEHFEIFAETDVLQAGLSSSSYTHVTVLQDFSPLLEGEVTVVLRDAAGTEMTFSQQEPVRGGIFAVEVVPDREGTFELAYRVETTQFTEDIPAGRVEVGGAGSLLEASPMAERAAVAAGSAQPIDFLKEQQWRTEFATGWVRVGATRESLRGPGRVRAVAGGEVLLSAPVAALVSGTPWPYTGFAVEGGRPVFWLTPRVATGRSLAELEGTVEQLEAELEVAQQRQQRLADLYELGAASRRETQEAEAGAEALAARLGAARRDLDTAKAGRQAELSSGDRIPLRAPFDGRVAEISVTPGEAVAAGTTLARVVRPRPLWVELSLRPEVVSRLQDPFGLILESRASAVPRRFTGEQVRLVSVSPSVDPGTGKVAVIFEVEASTDELQIGSRVEAEILLAGEVEGIVIPSSALVDDGGVTVVYLQLEGESVARMEVRALRRQGDLVEVSGLEPGSRLVTTGGNSIRRATLVAADVGEGHVH